MKKNRMQKRIENNKLRRDNERLQKTCNILSDERQFWIKKGTEEKKRADKFEKKYFDKLKDQMEYNHKDVVTISLMVSREAPYFNSAISKEMMEDYHKRAITKMIAEELYQHFECVRKTELQIGTRVDFMLLKWNDEQARQEYEEMKKDIEFRSKVCYQAADK